MDLRGDNGGTDGGGMPSRASRDGLSFASPTSMTRLGKYDIIARLGQGGMAGVFLAVARGAVEDVRKLVVLKVLHEGLRHQDEYIQMFKREAKIAVDLAHPNVVNTYTVGQEDGQYCIVMEYLDGVPLSALLKTASGWSLEQRLPLLGALCLILSGLHYVHGVRDIDGNELQLVHRDLKPANILIGFDGQAKLLDFGVAKMTAPEAEQTQGLSIKGTMQYVAPEGLDPKLPIDKRYDVFAAGLVLWEIATGRRFWADHDHMQILRGLGDNHMSRILDEDKSVPAVLKQAIRRALAPSPDDRQATALELKRDIQSYLVSVGFRIDTDQLAGIVTDAFGDMQLQRRGVISRNLRVLRESRSAAAGVETTPAQPGKDSAVIPASSSSTDSATDVTLASSSQTALGGGPDSMNATKPNSNESRRRGLIAAAIALPLFAGVAYAAFGTDTDAPATHVASAGDVGAQRLEKTPAASTPDSAAAENPVREQAAVVEVTVSVSPPEAEILVDGKAQTSNPTVLRDSGGDAQHEVRARAPGHTDQVVLVGMDKTRTVEITLAAQTDGHAEAAPEPEKATRRQPRPIKRRQPAPAPTPVATAPAEDPPQPAKGSPSGPKPGDDIKKPKRRADEPAIDSEIPWLP